MAEGPKDATAPTGSANAAVKKRLPFDDDSDFAAVRRGFIATLDERRILNDDGKVVWDMGQWDFLEGEAPAEVNPSLWRQSQLNAVHGLFEVTDGLYQVRGFDLSNISFIRGETGWIVIDPLISAEVARAALDLANRELGERPVTALIYTHSHVDHFGGVRGIVDEADVTSGKVPILAPEGFLESAVSEAVIAGNAMTRRATYMYGNLLPKNPKGAVGAGLGQTTSAGSVGLIAPTDLIRETGETRTIDGVEIEFQMTPGAEAPAEMVFYFPALKALCMAEMANHLLHNLYTLRGAEVRDPLLWARHLDDSIERFGGRYDLVFGSHHWPVWGRAEATAYLEAQRDLYKFIHDQTIRMANQGLTMKEIAERLELPEALAQVWANRSYYGTLNHNAKAVYQKYLGWFDGNPATLHPLPPEEAARRYVEAMGGADALLGRAREAFEAGEYRWVAEMVNHLVFAEPQNEDARALQADALEQLGYVAEAGPWRNFYLTGAQELRAGSPKGGPSLRSNNIDFVGALTSEQVFDFMGVRLKAEDAEGREMTLSLTFPDKGETHTLTLKNGVLMSRPGAPEAPDASYTMPRLSFMAVIAGIMPLEEAAKADGVEMTGETEKLAELVTLLETPDFWFNIVEP